jgi:1-acyl-sn-glycerol-3-phosphate acyltransferase
MLSRADVANWPILGRLARLGGTIFVDRADKGSGARAIRAIRSALVAGETVSAFPEGTTFAGDEVRPFQPGVFSAAHGNRTPVVPVGLAYDEGSEYVGTTFGRHLIDLAARSRTRVSLVAGEPFEPARDTRTTTAEAHVRVQALVHEARERYRAFWPEGSRIPSSVRG